MKLFFKLNLAIVSSNKHEKIIWFDFFIVYFGFHLFGKKYVNFESENRKLKNSITKNTFYYIILAL